MDGHQGTRAVAKVANGHRRNQPISRGVTGKSQFLSGRTHHYMAGYLLHLSTFQVKVGLLLALGQAGVGHDLNAFCLQIALHLYGLHHAW